MSNVRLPFRLAIPLTLAVTAACGLISSDIGTVMFDLPERTYSFDTAKSGWNLPPATLPEVACTDDAGCCAMASAVGVACNMIICDALKCALKVIVETPPQTINLKMEAQGLGSLNKQSAIDVTVSKIGFDVTTNTMNVDLPPVELFVAPDGTTTASDSAAKRFGTVPSIPSELPVTNGTVTLDPVGQAAFVGFAHNFGTPFVFIARTTVIVVAGTPLPKGAVDIKIKGQLSAKPSL